MFAKNFTTILTEPFHSTLVDSIIHDLGEFESTLLDFPLSDRDKVVVLFAVANQALALITHHTNAVQDQADRRRIGKKFSYISKLLFESQMIYVSTTDPDNG